MSNTETEGLLILQRSNRCVTCSRTRDVHELGQVPSYCKGFQTMNLAEGVRCSDCAHIRRCSSIFGQHPESEACQFFPVRFLAAPTEPHAQACGQPGAAA